MQTEGMLPDWVHLPKKVRSESLWDSLHDGWLCRVESDLLDRTVLFTFDVDYLRDFHKIPEGVTFLFKFSAVQSARVIRYSAWPGAFKVPARASRQEQSRLIRDYHSKWREESRSWSEFEAIIQSGDDSGFEVLNADLGRNRSNIVALRLQGLINHTDYHQAFVRAESRDERQCDRAA